MRRASEADGLAGRIATVRRTLGMSQRAFAQPVGVTRNMITSYERAQGRYEGGHA